MLLHRDFFEQLTFKRQGNKRRVGAGVFQQLIVIPLAMSGPTAGTTFTVWLAAGMDPNPPEDSVLEIAPSVTIEFTAE